MTLSPTQRSVDEARDVFSGGRNCAQAVLAGFDDEEFVPSYISDLGAGFGGGVGKSGCVCGAITGAVITIGAYVDSLGLAPVASRELAENLSSTCIKKFKETHGATCCRVLKRENIPGAPRYLSHCAKLVEFSTEQVALIIAEHQRTLASDGTRAHKKSNVWDVLFSAKRLAGFVLCGLAVGLGSSAVFSLFLSLWFSVGLWIALLFGLVGGALGVVSLRISRHASGMLWRASSLVGMAGALILLGILLFEMLSGATPAPFSFAAVTTFQIASVGALGLLSLTTIFAIKVLEFLRYR